MELKSDASPQARILRARHLARVVPAAAEILLFSADLTAVQQSLVSVPPRTAGALAAALDGDVVAAQVPQLLAWLRHNAPPALRAAAERLEPSPSADWRLRVEACLEGRDDPDPYCTFVVEATVQPFAEAAALMRRAAATDDSESAGRLCPFCGRPPAVATLREAGHGAKRSLACGLCLREWPFMRIGCAACGESTFDRLPVFTADSIGNARLDACDTCRVYLKTIDFTRDGHAVAVVDDLATLSLDLWAREQGYHRAQRQLLAV